LQGFYGSLGMTRLDLNSTTAPAPAPPGARPQVLIPYDRREALTVQQAAELVGRSAATVRSWAALHDIGRRIGDGPWEISLPALMMHVENDRAALRAYLNGDRSSELVARYFRRSSLEALLNRQEG
jgi:hypothetical protein